jgi:hypothetical protein
MAEDLLIRMQQELQERMEQLRGAVAESDRLRADLRALDSEPAPPPEPEPPAALDCEPALAPEPLAAPTPEPERPPEPATPGEPETDATVISFSARDLLRPAVSRQAARRMETAPRPARECMVSPKVVRLMQAPRRPALERSGIVRVTAHGALARAAPVEVDELDVQPDHAQADRYEHAI